MECKYCGNTFRNLSSLNNHVKNAKYCLKKRGEKIPTSFGCSGCLKLFSSKNSLDIHSTTCIESIKQKHKKDLEQKEIMHKSEINHFQEKLKVKDLQIKDLQDKLQEVAIQAISRPTKNTQINNYIQKLECITEEHMKDQVDNLTIEHIQKGPEGYAEYALEYPLKNRIICVDYSRRKVKFKDKDGNVITDPEMTNIATKLFQSIKDKNKDLIFSYGTELRDRFGDEMDLVVKLLEYKNGVDNSADGSKPEFLHDFVKSVCCKAVVE